jgi:hypothetical protein
MEYLKLKGGVGSESPYYKPGVTEPLPECINLTEIRVSQAL